MKNSVAFELLDGDIGGRYRERERAQIAASFVHTKRIGTRCVSVGAPGSSSVIN